MKMCRVEILLSLSIGVLSLSSVSCQDPTNTTTFGRDFSTNVTANCSGSCGDCTSNECVLYGKYEELSVNDTVCNTQVLVRRGELQFPNCQLEDAKDTEQNHNFCDRLEFNDCQVYIPVEANSSNLLESGERVCHLNCGNSSTSHCLVFKWNRTEDMSGSGFGMAPSCSLETHMSSATLMPTSTIFPSTATMITNPPGTTMTPGVTNDPTSNTSPGMETPGYLYIAIGGGAAGGFLILVIILLLVVVCCLSAKVMKSKRQMQLKLLSEEQPENAMNNPTYTAERNPIIPVQINVFSPYHTVGSAEDTYDSIETDANQRLSRNRSNSKEDKCGNYSYVASDTCKKRPVIHEASSSLQIHTEFDGYSEIAAQQTPCPYESVIREDPLGHLSPPTRVKMPMTNDGYSHLLHLEVTDRSQNRFSAPLPLPSEEYSKLNVRALDPRRSDYYNIELTNLPSDNQQAQVLENEYSYLQDVSVPARHELPPSPSGFTPEINKSEPNNGGKPYVSAQNTQLGKTSQLLHNGARPLEDEELNPDVSLQALQVIKV